jgi:hypothetical protein
MLRRFRRLFLVLSTLGYACLGGGPSLWALGLNTQNACPVVSCHCKMTHGGAACPFCAALARKLGHRPHGCEMRQTPLAPQEAGTGLRSLPSQQPHILVSLGFHLQLAEALSLPLPSPRGSSYEPEPPTPIPD